jgi:hypothetical protein
MLILATVTRPASPGRVRAPGDLPGPTIQQKSTSTGPDALSTALEQASVTTVGVLIVSSSQATGHARPEALGSQDRQGASGQVFYL